MLLKNLKDLSSEKPGSSKMQTRRVNFLTMDTNQVLRVRQKLNFKMVCNKKSSDYLILLKYIHSSRLFGSPTIYFLEVGAQLCAVPPPNPENHLGLVVCLLPALCSHFPAPETTFSLRHPSSAQPMCTKAFFSSNTLKMISRSDLPLSRQVSA